MKRKHISIIELIVVICLVAVIARVFVHKKESPQVAGPTPTISTQGKEPINLSSLTINNKIPSQKRISQRVTSSYITPEMILIPSGTITYSYITPQMILTPSGTITYKEYNKESTVEITSFYIGKYEVTNKEYCLYDPSHKNSGDALPVVMVTWNEAVDYCKWLSEKAGKNYRLPTEAEWEYACRAGSTTDYYWGENMNQKTYTCPSIDDYAWYYDNSGETVHPVGQKKPNAWGLYDMAGNVWEWCSDLYDSSDQSRVYRGGSWNYFGSQCQSDIRNYTALDCGHSGLGFRIVSVP